jgi:hypothetical protein
MNSIARRVLFTSVSLLLLGMPVSSAHAADWDQAKVTEIAEQLADAVNQVHRSVVRTSTGSQVGSGQASSALRLKDRVRIARNESRHLAKVLQDGKGKDETVNVWKRLMSTVRDAREIGRTMFLEAPTQQKIARANEILDQLTPFYETESK